MKFKKRNYISFLAGSLFMIACGEQAELKKTGQLTKDEAARIADPMMESDLNAMSESELTTFLTVLKQRNRQDAKDL